MKLSRAEIRDRSWSQVVNRGLESNPALPLLTQDLRLRSEREQLDRVLSLYAVVACSFGFPRESATQWLAQESLEEALSSTDEQFLNGDDSLKLRKQSEVNGVYVLAWSLSIVPELKLDDEMPSDLVKKFPELWEQESSSAFRETVRSRECNQVVQALDEAYCLHWALQDARLDRRATEDVRWLEVVASRRLALEWLLSDQLWDEIALDT